MAQRTLPEKVLCLVTSLRAGDDVAPLLNAIQAGVRGGVNLVQVRAPELERTAYFELAAAVREAVGDDALVLVNNRVDVALAVDADGIQLGERGPAVNAARRTGGDERLIGRSVHSVDGALKAQSDGADFLLLGTLFETDSHPGQRGAGIELVREVVAAVDIPVIGIGGINAERAADIISAGARGVAVIGAILRSDHPESAAAELRNALVEAETADKIGRRD